MDSVAPHSPRFSRFLSPNDWRQKAAERDTRPITPWTETERAALQALNRSVGGGKAVERNIEALGNPATRVVVAGQQAGLFLTPFYILYKALCAVRWAERLSDLLERPVAPIFWVASEDHDFEEVRHTAWLSREGRCKRWTYTPPGFAPSGRSVFDIPVASDTLESFLTRLETEAPDSEFKKSQVGQWRALVDDSENLEDFFLRGLAHLCGAMGLILLPARLAPVRRRAVPVIECEIRHPGAFSKRLAERADGEKAPIHRAGNEANFFLYRDGQRCKVMVEGETFRVHTAPGAVPIAIGSDALLEELHRTPEHFSPNVVTRPVVQDTVLPTLAMVAGPGEVRYLSQLAEAGAHAFYEASACAVLPRTRVLLLEPRIERVLEKRRIPLEWIERDDWEAVEARLSEGEELDGGDRVWAELTHDAQTALMRLREQLGRLARRPAVATALEKTERAWLQAAARLEERVSQERRLETKVGVGQRTRVLESLRPGGQPQERVFGPLAPFLIQYGPNLIPWILNKLDLERNDLQILRLEEFLKNKPSLEKSEMKHDG